MRPTSPQGSSQIEKDPLYKKMAHGASRATQVCPNYQEFRLGHGDPLLAASVSNEKHMAKVLASAPKKLAEEGYQPEIHLLEKGSPLGGFGINDMVHLSDHSVMSLPCLPMGLFSGDKKDDNRKAEERDPHYSDSLLGNGMGLGDSIHLANGEVVRVPILPSWNLESDEGESDDEEEFAFSSPIVPMKDIVLSEPLLPPSPAKKRLDIASDEETPEPVSPNVATLNPFRGGGGLVSGVLGMSDHIRLADGRVLNVPCLPLSDE